MKQIIIIETKSIKAFKVEDGVITEIKLKRKYKGKNKPVKVTFETINKSDNGKD